MQRNVQKCREMYRNAEKFREMQRSLEKLLSQDGIHIKSVELNIYGLDKLENLE